MRLRSPKLEKAIRDLAREELASSPELLAEFNRRRKARFVKRVCAIPWCVGAAFLAVMFLSVLLHPAEPLPGEQNGAEFALVTVGLVVLGCLSLFCEGSRNDPKGLGDLAIYAAIHFPVRDGDLIARNRKHWAVIVFFVTLAGAWLNCHWCVFWNHPVVWEHLAALGVALLQAALVTAICRTLINLPDKPPVRDLLAFLGLVVCTAGFIIGWVAAKRGDMFDCVTHATFLLSPLGWAHGALYWGVIQGHAAAYLLLIPPLALLGALVYRIRRESWSDDFFFDADRLAEVAAPRGDDRLRKPGDRRKAAHATRPPEARSTEVVEQRLLQGRWLRGDVWTPRGPIDRFALRALNPREKVLIECLHRRGSVLTIQWGVTLLFLLVSGFIFLISPPEEKVQVIIPMMTASCWGLVCLAPLGEMSRTFRYSLFTPIGFHEVSKAMFKLGLIKCLFWLPLSVGFGLAIAWRHEISLLSAVGLGLLPAVLYLGWLPAGACFVFGPLIERTGRWPTRIFELTCLSFACVATLFFAAPLEPWRLLMPQVPPDLWRFLFAAVLFVCVGVIWACSARAFRGSGSRKPVP